MLSCSQQTLPAVAWHKNRTVHRAADLPVMSLQLKVRESSGTTSLRAHSYAQYVEHELP